MIHYLLVCHSCKYNIDFILQTVQQKSNYTVCYPIHLNTPIVNCIKCKTRSRNRRNWYIGAPQREEFLFVKQVVRNTIDSEFQAHFLTMPLEVSFLYHLSLKYKKTSLSNPEAIKSEIHNCQIQLVCTSPRRAPNLFTTFC